MSDPTELTIAGAAALVESRELSPVELTRAYLARIDQLNGAVNAYITVTGDRALDDARRAESEITAGEYRGPLHGIPIALKDIIDTAGILSTSGSKIRAEHIPVADAGVTTKLADAGAVLLGKLNTHEFALGGTNINPHYGAAHNPWNLSMITGGSSGGSGAATTARMAAGTIGTDTGGSIRIPAALCGCVGLKPTFGRVSKRGVFPISQMYDHVGPIARTVEDAAIMLQAIAGYDPADPYSVRTPVDSYLPDLKSGIAGLRIGVPGGTFADEPTSEMQEAFQTALELLASLGAIVVPSSLKVSTEEVAGALMPAIRAEAQFVHRHHLVNRRNDFGADVRELFLGPSTETPMDYLGSVAAGEAIRTQFRLALTEVDLLATPTTPVAALPIDTESTTIDGRPFGHASVALLTSPMDVAQVPTLTVPCGFDRAGLPFGLSFTGKPFDEALVLRAGYAYEQAAEWRLQRPTDPC